MVKEYAGSMARKIIGFADLSIDDQIAAETEMLQLRQSRPDITDARVSKEALYNWRRYHEQNCQRVRQYVIRDQESFVEFRGGRTFHMYDFVRRLNTLGRRRFVLNTWSNGGMRGMSVSRGGAPLTYVCAVNDGAMPEWSRISLDAHGLRKREVARGWRTVLVALHGQGLISENEMMKLFGHPWGQSGRIFRRTMWEMRNQKLSDGAEDSEYFRLKERRSFTNEG